MKNFLAIAILVSLGANFIYSSEINMLSSSDSLAKHISSDEIEEVILDLSNNKISDSRKRSTLNYIRREMEIRKSMASSLLKSKVDLRTFIWGGVLTAWAVSLLKSSILFFSLAGNPRVVEALKGQFTTNVVDRINQQGRNGLSEAEIEEINNSAKAMGSLIPNIIGMTVGSVSFIMFYKGFKNLNSGLSREFANKKLKKMHAIEEHVKLVPSENYN